MRVLVCGDRNWLDRPAILGWMRLEKQLASWQGGRLSVIEGGASGADSIAWWASHKIGGIPVFHFPAQWDLYGLRAGFVRNQRMLYEGNPDAILAFHDDIRASKGTRDMVQRGLLAGLPVGLGAHNSRGIVEIRELVPPFPGLFRGA